MDRIPQETELEMMLLSRHYVLGHRAARSEQRLDRSAYVLLSRLEVSGPMSIPELHDAFGLDSSTLNRQTAAMGRAGLVERIPDEDGGIARKFRITDLGRDRLTVDRDELVTAIAKITRDWPAADRTALARVLRRFNEGVEELDGRPWPRDR